MLRVSLLVLIPAYLAVLCAVPPVYPYLDLPVQLLLPLALGWGLVADRRQRLYLPKLPATVTAVLLFAGYLTQLSLSNLVLPVINLLVLLLAVRLVSAKEPRDILQIFTLSLFTLAASSLLTLNMAYLVYLLLEALTLAIGLVLLSYYHTDQQLTLSRAQLKRLLSWCGLLPLGALLLMLGFFAILPRTDYPLWRFLNPAPAPRTGFSEQVRPGSIADLADDTSVAFRAEMETVPQDQLYWRATVLNQTDGAAWQRREPAPTDIVQPGSDQPIRQQLFLEPRSDRYLPSLNLPEQLSGRRVSREGDDVYRAAQPLRQRTQLQAATRLDSTLQLRYPAAADRYLQLPEQLDPRLRQIGERIRSQGKTRSDRLQLLEQYFADQQLSYAKSGLQLTNDPVVTFLFETRRGYCEYFASAFALLARLSDLPARLAGGYLGGEYNPIGGYYLVSEETAHVWVEVLDDANRWVRVDPSRLAVNAEAALLQAPGRRRVDTPWLTSLVDSLDHAWNRTVISYDLSRQFELLHAARRNLRSLRQAPQNLLPWLVALLGCGALVAGGRYWKTRRTGSPGSSLGRSFLQLAQRRSETPLPPGCSLSQAARILRHPAADRFAAVYGASIYRDQVLNEGEIRQLKQLLGEIERAGRNA